MTMRFRLNRAWPDSTASGALKFIYDWFDFMRQPSPAGPGWTVPASSDGSTVDTGGSGANITSYTDLQTYSAGSAVPWFILRAPDGGREIMVTRTATSFNSFGIRYSPSAHFLSNLVVTTWPGAADGKGVWWADFLCGSGGVLHMGADDAAPYPLWVWAHAAGDFDNGKWSMAMMPLDVATEQPGETDPVVWWKSDNDGEWTAAEMGLGDDSSITGGCWGLSPVDGVWRNIPAAWLHAHTWGQVIPGFVNPDANGDDISFPIFYVRSNEDTNSCYKGISSFVQWKGNNRPTGSTFNSLSKCCVGDVVVDWDGATTPLASP